MKQFETGEKAYVINQTLSGTYIVEGMAMIIKNEGDGAYVVDFGDGQPCVRFIDPRAQRNPARYVADLNAV